MTGFTLTTFDFAMDKGSDRAKLMRQIIINDKPVAQSDMDGGMIAVMLLLSRPTTHGCHLSHVEFRAGTMEQMHICRISCHYDHVFMIWSSIKLGARGSLHGIHTKEPASRWIRKICITPRDHSSRPLLSDMPVTHRSKP